jgi:tRNA1Val (adenine37-N6)-methyltransferase
MSKRECTNRLTGVEIQEELYELALRNRELNGCENVQFIKGDVREKGRELAGHRVIVSNPPYVKERTGRKSPGASRLIARHESGLNLGTLLCVTSSMLDTRGRLYLIYPAQRVAELLHAARGLRLEPKRLRFIHSRPGEPAVLSLVEFLKGGGSGLRVEPPLFIYGNYDYTEEVREYYT